MVDGKSSDVQFYIRAKLWVNADVKLNSHVTNEEECLGEHWLMRSVIVE